MGFKIGDIIKANYIPNLVARVTEKNSSTPNKMGIVITNYHNPKIIGKKYWVHANDFEFVGDRPNECPSPGIPHD